LFRGGGGGVFMHHAESISVGGGGQATDGTVLVSSKMKGRNKEIWVI